MSLRERIFAWLRTTHFRPWAMALPIAVLLVSMPLLRPLAEPAGPGARESMLLASVESVVRGRGLALDSTWRGRAGTVEIAGRVYASSPPMLAVLLAGPAVMLERLGITFDRAAPVMAYWLTFFGVTLPVAFASGFIYRSTRIFQITRGRRILVASACVFGSGWISYAAVLNPHAPAAACLMLAMACLIAVGFAVKPARSVWVLLLAGQLAALAAVIDPWTLPLVVPLALVVVAMPMPMLYRALGVVMMTVGAAPVVWAHSAWSLAAFGSILPPAWDSPFDRDVMMLDLRRASAMLLGPTGLVLIFPMLAVGLAGLWRVIHRNWPAQLKVLGAITLVGAFIVMWAGVSLAEDRPGESFAAPWALAFAPMMVFWTGGLLVRPLSVPWRIALGLVVFASIASALLGMTIYPPPMEL
jgi:hypothetical protein